MMMMMMMMMTMMMMSQTMATKSVNHLATGQFEQCSTNISAPESMGKQKKTIIQQLKNGKHRPGTTKTLDLEIIKFVCRNIVKHCKGID